MFSLHQRLEADSTFVMDLFLCTVRLTHNAIFPWILLIPRREKIVEIIDLSALEQQQLLEEIVLASRVMKSLFHPCKLNIGSLGNVVPQLHVHVIARHETDPAWPNPVWNSGFTASYEEKEKNERINLIQKAFLTVRP